MLVIRQKFKGIDLDIEFSNQINILVGDSGQGKTYMLSLLSAMFIPKNEAIYLNYQTVTDVYGWLNLAKGKPLVLLDNADLYMTPELFLDLANSGSMIVASLKSITLAPMLQSGRYQVIYNKGYISVRKLDGNKKYTDISKKCL